MKVFPFCFIVIACGAISGFHHSSARAPRLGGPNEGSIKFIARGRDAHGGCRGDHGSGGRDHAPTRSDYYLNQRVPKVVAAARNPPRSCYEPDAPRGEETLQAGPGCGSLAVGMANILGQIPRMGS